MQDERTVRCASGVVMPRLVYGTAWKKGETAACVQRALAAGFRGIDTACQPKHYDEPSVGQGIAAFLSSAEGRGLSREDLYLQTKFTPLSGQDPARVPYDAGAPLEQQVAESVAASLRNLGTGRLDGLVLHSPLGDADSTLRVWRAMERAVDADQVRQLGLSNCYELDRFVALYEAARIKPMVLQNRFYQDTGYDRELRAFCLAHAVVYQSFWTLTANRHLLDHSVLRALASAHRRTPAQVLFRYLTQEGVVPLTGTRSEAHMREDLSIFLFELTLDERAALTQVLLS